MFIIFIKLFFSDIKAIYSEINFYLCRIKFNIMAANNGKVITLSKREFKEKIFNYSAGREWDYKGDMPAVIDFYADWCMPCKMVAPLLNQLSVEYDGKVKFYKVNTEKDPEVAKVFGISSIPTLLFIPPEGKPSMVRGAQSISALRRNVEKLIPGGEKGFLQNLFSFARKS
jgi:thioredoxin